MYFIGAQVRAWALFVVWSLWEVAALFAIRLSTDSPDGFRAYSDTIMERKVNSKGSCTPATEYQAEEVAIHIVTSFPRSL